MNTNMYIVCNLKEEHIEGVCAYIVFFYQKIMSVIGKRRKYFLLLNEKCQQQ